MGYLTKHKLELVSGYDPKIDYQSEIEELSEYGESTFEESVKWYEHEDHMKIISLKYPQVIFKLFGEGEETGDLWAEFYKGGKVQRAKAVISYPEFEESKLK